MSIDRNFINKTGSIDIKCKEYIKMNKILVDFKLLLFSLSPD